MTGVLGVEIACEVDDRTQSNELPQGAAVLCCSPGQYGPGTHERISLGLGEPSEVTQDALLVAQLESGRPPRTEVTVNGCAQHDTVSGQG